MKIVHLCLSCFFIDNYSYQENMLPKYHVLQGLDVTVIASLESYNEKGESCLLKASDTYFDKNGYKVIRLAYKKPSCIYQILRRYAGFKQALLRERPDIIFAHGVSFADATIVRAYKRRYPNTLVFADSHTDFINSAKNILSKKILHPIIWRHYAKVLEPLLVKCYGVTPLRCRFLRDVYHISPEKISFLPMGIDDDIIPKDRLKTRITIRRELGISLSDIVVFTGGKIDKLKNTHILLEAIQQLSAKKLHIIICGVLTPEMDYLNDIFRGNPKYIHYLGWCDAQRVIDCMVASDIACFPGTHSTLWEQAVGVGLPSIFKRWDDMEHVNVNGNCLFVKGEDVDELKVALDELLENKESYLMLANEASHYFCYSQISRKAIGLP